jgi:hypothetical protein
MDTIGKRHGLSTEVPWAVKAVLGAMLLAVLTFGFYWNQANTAQASSVVPSQPATAPVVTEEPIVATPVVAAPAPSRTDYWVGTWDLGQGPDNAMSTWEFHADGSGVVFSRLIGEGHFTWVADGARWTMRPTKTPGAFWNSPQWGVWTQETSPDGKKRIVLQGSLKNSHRMLDDGTTFTKR